jgi:hypothetical protein
MIQPFFASLKAGVALPWRQKNWNTKPKNNKTFRQFLGTLGMKTSKKNVLNKFLYHKP